MSCRSLLCRLLFCALIGCCSTLTSTAADKPAAAPKLDPAMEEMMKLANPGPMHEKLEPLAGTFKTVVKMWNGPGEPEVSEGTSTSEWILGGRFLSETFRGTFSGMPFEGHGRTHRFTTYATIDGKEMKQMEITYTR